MPHHNVLAHAEPRVFLILLDGARGRTAAEGLHRLAAPAIIRTLIPPLTGAEFLEDATSGGDVIDSWWEDARVGRDRPVVLAAHEHRLPGTLAGFDADFVVAVPDAQLEPVYAGFPNVRALVTDDPLRLAQLAVREHIAPASLPAQPPDPFVLLAQAVALAVRAQPRKQLTRLPARLRAARRTARAD